MILRLSLVLPLVLLLPAAEQTTLNLHVTGQVQSVATTKRNFGRLPKGYRAADWTVTNQSAQPVKVSLARLLQEIHPGRGVSILSGVSATSVVEDAQGSNPLNTVARVGSGIVAGLAVGQGLKIIPSGGSWPTVILGAEVATLVMQYVFPTLQTHALQSITAMMPATLALDALGTESGMVIVELAKKSADPPTLDLTISIPYLEAKP